MKALKFGVVREMKVAWNRTAPCKKCGEPFDVPPPPHHRRLYCDKCSDWIKWHRSYYVESKLAGRMKEIRAAADQSGNPRIWTAKECSQDFLRSLIPSGR